MLEEPKFGCSHQLPTICYNPFGTDKERKRERENSISYTSIAQNYRQ